MKKIEYRIIKGKSFKGDTVYMPQKYEPRFGWIDLGVCSEKAYAESVINSSISEFEVIEEFNKESLNN